MQKGRNMYIWSKAGWLLSTSNKKTHTSFPFESIHFPIVTLCCYCTSEMQRNVLVLAGTQFGAILLSHYRVNWGSVTMAWLIAPFYFPYLVIETKQTHKAAITVKFYFFLFWHKCLRAFLCCLHLSCIICSSKCIATTFCCVCIHITTILFTYLLLFIYL